MTGLPVAPLFVPGDRPDRVEKAARSGADAVILDLEDAVDASAKPAARETAISAEAGEVPLYVRINGADSEWFAPDLEALARRARPPVGIVLPKAESPRDLDRIRNALGPVRVVPLIETARGLSGVARLLSHEAVPGLAFGSIDYALDLGCSPDWEPLLSARAILVLESRLAGRAPPLDGVTASFRDAERLTAEAARARAMGFGGKLAIHPAQVAGIVAAFRPAEAEIDWARRVVEGARTNGAVSVDGQMIDRPLVEQARRILARAGAAPGP